MSNQPKQLCPHMRTCELYPLFSLKAVLRVWQTNYCEAKFSECVRYIGACAGDVIPPNLLPNGRLLQISELPSHGEE